MAHRFHPTLLREYDIRGVVGRTLGEADGYAVGRSFGTIVRRMGVRRAGGSRVAVGYDGRLSSPALEQAVVQGLQDSGTDVVRIGLGPTPMPYYAEAAFDVDGGVQITGRSEEHTSELQSLMRISYAVFCLKTKKSTATVKHTDTTPQP